MTSDESDTPDSALRRESLSDLLSLLRFFEQIDFSGGGAGVASAIDGEFLGIREDVSSYSRWGRMYCSSVGDSTDISANLVQVQI